MKETIEKLLLRPVEAMQHVKNYQNEGMFIQIDTPTSTNDTEASLNSIYQQFNPNRSGNECIYKNENYSLDEQDDPVYNNSFMFNQINSITPILDNEPSKFKSSLIKRGSLATRQLPQLLINNESLSTESDMMMALGNEEHSNKCHATSTLVSSTTTTSSYISGNYYNGSVQQDNVISFTQPIEEWSSESVAQWLAINDLATYTDSFLDKSIDGEKFLNLDSAKLKVTLNLYFFNSNRDVNLMRNFRHLV